MRLYYGADQLITCPEHGKGNSSNDYGVGFYLTDDIEIARLWATRFDEGGYCISYDADVNKMKICHLEESTDENILSWIAILIKHRFSKVDYESNKATIDWLYAKYGKDYGDYDMIIGYRADDSYFSYSKDFVQNALSLELLGHAMKIGKLGKQYVLKSPKAFNNIKMISYERVEKSDAYEQFRRRALNDYHILKKQDDIKNTYIRDLMRKDD